jgi:hypothetical protein
MARRLVFLTVAALFFTALLLATVRESAVECEVCMEFKGDRACRTGSASTRAEAQRGAVTAACAVLAGGVTQRLECDRTRPRSMQCSE